MTKPTKRLVRKKNRTSSRASLNVAFRAARRPTSERIDWSMGLVRMLRDIKLRVPELDHLEPDRILVTAGQARKRSRATIRPYAFGETATRHSASGHLFKPLVKVGGRTIRYEIILRPLFFLRSTPLERLRTLFHELYHLAPRFDGTLAEERRHSELPRKEFDAELVPLVKAYATVAPTWVHELLSHEGEVLVLQWLERPANRYRSKDVVRQRYTEQDLFLGPVPMRAKPIA